MAFFDINDDGYRALIVFGLFWVGCFEAFILKSEAAACLTWWICILSLSTWIMYPSFTLARICIGSIVFVLGIILLRKYSRWMKGQ